MPSSQDIAAGHSDTAPRSDRAGLWSTFWGKAFRACFYLYYWLVANLLKVVVGREALAYVLYDSLRPELVLKLGGAKIGSNVRIGRWLTVHASEGSFKNLRIGNDVFFGKHCVVDLTGKVTLGDRCGVGAKVTLVTHLNFGDSVLSAEYPPSHEDVEIKEDAVIGWGTIVLKGTTIGRGAIVLPGAVVRGELKEFSTYGGNPARMLPRSVPGTPS